MSGPATVACPNGHVSADQVFCTVCGTWLADPTRFGPDERPPTASTPTVVPNPAAPGRVPPAVPAAGGTGGGAVCSYCSSELDPDTRFCEVCGYDPETGSLPAAPVVQPVVLPPVDPLTPSGSSSSTPSTPYPGSISGAVSTPSAPYPGSISGGVPAAVPGTPSGPVGTAGVGPLLAVVTTDRAYYDSQQVGDVQFPVGAPPRVIELPAGPATIGRRSRSLGTDPAVDLAIPPEDPAVSHTHASLLPAEDGTWSLVDHGSTNGTYLNESPEPLAANVPRTVHPGDRIYVGAWTRITLELRAH